MNILFVTHAPPFPPNDGARLIVANLARVLSARHSLALVCLSADDARDAEVTKHFTHVRMVPHPTRALWRKWARTLVDATPLWIRAHESIEMRNALREVAREGAIEVAHFDTGLVAQYADALPATPRVLAAHDSMTRVAQQHIARAPRWRERIVARWQVNRLRAYEARAYDAFARVIVVTASERAFLQNIAPSLNLRVIPNGVDSNYFAPLPHASAPNALAFLGVMDYAPNQAAALFFANEILPRVWRAIPDATFTIIGRHPPPLVRALTRDARIRVTGEVADVRPFVAAASVMVCPMRDAGGIKNKLLEALAMGKAIVATPNAVEGTDARAGDEFVLARDAEEFARACIQLLRDDAERARLGRNARAWALDHSWTRTAAQYEAVYREAIAARC